MTKNKQAKLPKANKSSNKDQQTKDDKQALLEEIEKIIELTGKQCDGIDKLMQEYNVRKQKL